MSRKARIEEKIEQYCHFEGIVLSSSKIAEIVLYLDRFSYNEEELHNEMVCVIRSANGD